MSKTPAFNPYLPSWEYIPDGEPYVFGDRVYVYGCNLTSKLQKVKKAKKAEINL